MESLQTMNPELFNHAATGSRQLDLWFPVLGVIIVFVGMNIRIDIKIQNEEDLEDND